MANVGQFVYAWIESLKVREDEGQGLVEYGLIIGLVGVFAIVALKALGTNISGLLTGISFT